MASDAPRPMAKYDLTQKIAPYLDLHMMYPILQWLGENDMYDKHDLQEATFELCKKTNMIDYAMEIYKGLHPDEEAPAELMSKRQEVVQKYQQLSKAAAPLLQLIEEGKQIQELKADDKWNLQGLAEIDIQVDDVEATYDFSKYLMDCGVYDQCLKNLRVYRSLVPDDHERSFQALWGQLVADILSHGEGGLQALYSLRDAIDSRTFVSPLEQLQQRTWLLHWSLFVFFNRPDGARLICEFFFQGRESTDRNDRRGRRNQQQQDSEYVNVIQTNCPWMLRYLAAAVIIQKWRRNMSDLVEVIRQERTNYNDPITQLLEALYVNHDLEGAKVMLRECESVMRSDYFFSFRGDEFIDEFITSARKLIFKKFCLIHQKIDITQLSRQLHMDRNEAEKWMVDLIRNNTTQMDNAKIDSANSLAIMEVQYPSIYERIIEKTQDLAVRSYELANNLQRARYQN